MGHKYYFATFGIFQEGKHKSWRKSTDPHFSLSYKWETLFNASKSDESKLDFVKFEFTQNMESVSKLAKQYDAQYMIPNKQYISSNI